MLKAGDKFPDFKLQNQDGRTRCLADFAGHWLVLYTYPKDDVPTWTIKWKQLTEQREAFRNLGVRVVGLSADDAETHKKFCAKYNIAIELLADPARRLLDAAGVRFSEWRGTSFWDRNTIVIDPRGTIHKIYERVDPKTHDEDLLRDLTQFVG